jgi:hypothetical protein
MDTNAGGASAVLELASARLRRARFGRPVRRLRTTADECGDTIWYKKDNVKR